MKPAIDDNTCSVPRTPCNNNSTALGTWSNNIKININKIQISGQRARCSLSKLVTDGISRAKKCYMLVGGMHPPHPPPWIRHWLESIQSHSSGLYAPHRNVPPDDRMQITALCDTFVITMKRHELYTYSKWELLFNHLQLQTVTAQK